MPLNIRDLNGQYFQLKFLSDILLHKLRYWYSLPSWYSRWSSWWIRSLFWIRSFCCVWSCAKEIPPANTRARRVIIIFFMIQILVIKNWLIFSQYWWEKNVRLLYVWLLFHGNYLRHFKQMAMGGDDCWRGFNPFVI